MARIASRRHRLIAPAVGMTVALLLSGCAAGKISQTASQVAAIDGASATVGKIGIRDARLATTSDFNYPAGSDVPVLFWLSNTANNTDSLTGISSSGAASVELSGPTGILGSSLTEVGTETATTVTIKGLKDVLHYGQTLPVTFTFAAAGQVTLNLPITNPPERTDERPTVNILPEHGKDLWFSENEHEGEAGGAGEDSVEGGGDQNPAEPTEG